MKPHRDPTPAEPHFDDGAERTVPRLRREVVVATNEQARLSAIVGVSSMSGIAVGLTLSLLLGFVYMPTMSGRTRAATTVPAAAPIAERVWLGVNVTTVETERGMEGARVLRVHDGSPADRAGLLAGDVIRTLDGTAVRNAEHLVRLVRSVEAGALVMIGLDRGDKGMLMSSRLHNAPAHVVSWLD